MPSGDVLLSESLLSPSVFDGARAASGVAEEHRRHCFALGRARAKFGRLRDACNVWQTCAACSGICEDSSSSAVSDEQSDVEAGIIRLFSP